MYLEINFYVYNNQYDNKVYDNKNCNSNFLLREIYFKMIKRKSLKVYQPHENLYKKKRVLNIRKEIFLIYYIKEIYITILNFLFFT